LETAPVKGTMAGSGEEDQLTPAQPAMPQYTPTRKGVRSFDKAWWWDGKAWLRVEDENPLSQRSQLAARRRYITALPFAVIATAALLLTVVHRLASASGDLNIAGIFSQVAVDGGLSPDSRQRLDDAAAQLSWTTSVEYILLAVCAAVFLLWLFIAYRNFPSLSVVELEYSPVSAVGGGLYRSLTSSARLRFSPNVGERAIRKHRFHTERLDRARGWAYCRHSGSEL
jgi:hypothetical protein